MVILGKVFAVTSHLLAAIQTEQDIAKLTILVEKLTSAESQIWNDAKDNILTLGPVAIEVLNEAAESDDPRLQQRATDVLLKILSTGEGKQARIHMIGMYTQHLTKEQIQQNQEIIKAIETESAEKQERLIIRLRQLADAKGHPPEQSSTRSDLLAPLAKALDSDSVEVCKQAILAVAYMNHKAAYPLLASSLVHPDSSVRYYAIMGLEWIGRQQHQNRKVVAALVVARDRHSESHFDVTLHAVTALQSLGEKQDPGILITAMRIPEANHSMAMEALLKIDDDEVWEWIINWLARVDPAAARIGPEQYKRIKEKIVERGTKTLPLLDAAIKQSGGTLIEELRGIRSAILSKRPREK